jgi:F0F1-type ATP synthase membrane subunit a
MRDLGHPGGGEVLAFFLMLHLLRLLCRHLSLAFRLSLHLAANVVVIIVLALPHRLLALVVKCGQLVIAGIF